jgi:hypothetical protein
MPIFTGKRCKIFMGTPSLESAYTWRRRGSRSLLAGAIGEQTMRDAKDVLRVVGMILLGVFVLMVVAPLALKVIFEVVGITFSLITVLVGLAVLLIKVAVVLAIGYLILVGIRALLR